MGKYFDDDYNEVEAYSKEELEAKLKEERDKLEKDSGSKTSELEKKVQELEDQKAKAEEKFSKRSEEYNNLKKKFDETGETLKSSEEEKQATYEKLRDNMINKLAGDDTEYAEKLKEKYERVGSMTLDPTELESQMKDAHAMALTALDREISPFSMSGAPGKPPEQKKPEGARFSETDEGKATLDVVYQSMGMDKPKAEDKK